MRDTFSLTVMQTTMTKNKRDSEVKCLPQAGGKVWMEGKEYWKCEREI